MAIFPNAELEAIVQVNDKTRLDATKSFVDKGEAAITLVEIEPEAAAGFIDVTGSLPIKSKNWFLDWQYATDGVKTVTVRVTTDGAPVTASNTLTIISVADDKLFSADSDLIKHEPEILQDKNLPDGRNSFLNVQRRSQELILAFLDENGVVDIDGNRLTKADILDVEEVRQWSTFLSLRLIFEGLSNAIDDIFSEKAKRYETMEISARGRAQLRVDVNNDGILDDREGINMKTMDLVRQ